MQGHDLNEIRATIIQLRSDAKNLAGIIREYLGGVAVLIEIILLFHVVVDISLKLLAYPQGKSLGDPIGYFGRWVAIRNRCDTR